MAMQDTRLLFTQQGAAKLQAAEDASVRQVPANLARFHQSIKEYEYLKQAGSDLIDEIATYAEQMAPNDPTAQEQIFDSKFEVDAAEWRKQMQGVKDGLSAAFQGGAYLQPELVMPEDWQAEDIRAARPTRLTENQAIQKIIESSENLDEKLDAYIGRLRPEQAKRLEELTTKPQWNPFQERGLWEKAFSYLDPGGQANWGAALATWRESQNLAPASTEQPLEFGQSANKTLNDLARAAGTGVLGAIPGAKTAYTIGEALVKPTGGAMLAQGAARAAATGELGSKVGEAMKARAFDPSALPTEAVAGRAENLYREAAQKYALQELPSGTPEQVQARADEYYEAFLQKESTVGRFLIEHPGWSNLVGESALSPWNAVNPATLLKATGKLVGGVANLGVLAGSEAAYRLGAKGTTDVLSVADLARKAGETKVGGAVRDVAQEAADKVAGSAIGSAVQHIRDKFTYAPEKARFAKTGERAASAMTEVIADEARIAQEAEQFAQQTVGQLKRIRSGEKIAKRLGVDLFELAESTGPAPKELVDALSAVRELRPEMYRYASEAGLMRDWLKFDTAADFSRHYGLTPADAQRAVDAFGLRSDPRAMLEKLAGESETIRVAVLNAFDDVDTLQGLPGRMHYVPHVLPAKPERAAGESFQQWQNRIWKEKNEGVIAGGGESMGRAKLKAAGAHARTGETLPLRDVYEQFKRKASEELPKAVAAKQLRSLHDNLQKRGLVQQVPKAIGEATLTALQRKMPDMEWVAIAHAGERQSKLLQHTAASDVQGIEEIFQRITAPTGTRKGDYVTLMPREMFEATASLLPIITPKEAEGAKKFFQNMSSLVTPYMQALRAGKTITSYAFGLRNIQSAIGIDYLARGVESLNPKTQGLAIAASFATALGDDAKALKAAERIPFKLQNGEKVTLGWAIGEAKKLGIMGGLDQKLALETGVEGNPLLRFVQGAAEFDAPGLRKIKALSPGYIAKATENYQHFVSFLGFLQGTAKADIDKAFQLSAKETGYFRHLGEWEKGPLRNTLTFYGWNRWVLPRMARALYEVPHRVAAYARAMGGIQKYFGRDNPYAWQGDKPFLNFGFHAQDLRKTIPGITSHEYAVGVMDNPLLAGYAFLPAVARGLGFKVPHEGPKLYELLAPALHFGIEALTERDIQTGQPLASFWADAGPPAWMVPMYSVAQRTTESAMDLYRLYNDEAMRYDKALGLQLRLKVGRDFAGLDNQLARMVGAEGRSIGGMFDPQTGGIPGVQQYHTNPLIEMARRQRDAVNRMPAVQSEHRRQRREWY